ncbi:uncharacterized protein LOC132282429 isoform X2 [Cornus florida]|uniref:uncharacterized protein LOC132282429 isoform X2 n=1 Tax=Cornus florida TaxID=4283 RepID=UPI00289636A8|nr:uncharacterized protein LOC132282429 isoform X2 [Cornus florida]
MDSISVNWEALDSLVIDFAKSENVIEDSVSSPSSPSSSSYHSRLLIRQIRRLVEVGDVDAAIDLLRAHASFVLDDHRLLFRLQKQKFIELLRRGTEEDRDSALKCLRTALAPCALDAYPEAYEEFKHVLLAFIYDKDDHTSPVANEWSERRRFDIAGLLSSVLRAHLHAYDPVFSMTLRYLISIHKGFCFRQGILSPISDLTERLLLEERDPPATPQESLYEAPPFDEVDIQALAHAVELTRQGAIDSLRFAKGDLFQAFQNEICRMRLDVSMLDELVHEYCVYRGIVDSGLTSPSGNCSLDVESGASKNSNSETSINNARMNSSPEINVDMVSMHGTETEERYPSETTSNHEDCSTSGKNHTENSRVSQRSRIHGIGERSKRKRWRGRHENLDSIPDILSGSSKQDLSTTTLTLSTSASKEHQGFEKDTHPTVDARDDKFEIVLGMKELASRGMAAEVVEEINAMDPNFFSRNPILLFQLKQVEFLKLVRSGNHSSALKVACSHLGPMATSDPALLKPLKETLLALLKPNEDALCEGLPLLTLATSLQVAIGRRFGIEEPQLMKIMRTSLYTHNTCTHGSSQVTACSSSRMQEDGSSPSQVSSRDIACDENAILKVMEFLALPRADAIHLLAQYDGNAETVIQQIFG